MGPSSYHLLFLFPFTAKLLKRICYYSLFLPLYICSPTTHSNQVSVLITPLKGSYQDDLPRNQELFLCTASLTFQQHLTLLTTRPLKNTLFSQFQGEHTVLVFFPLLSWSQLLLLISFLLLSQSASSCICH